MTRINTNISSLTAQNTLAKTNAALQTSLTRLSTGLRINSGKDSPAGLIASESLGSEIVRTDAAIANSEAANKMIATADSALSQISSLLKDIQGLISDAANSGTLSAAQIAANQLQIDSSLAAINRIAQTTSYQGKNLLDGSLGFVVSSTDADYSVVESLDITQANLGSSGKMSNVTVDITTAASKAQLTATLGGAAKATTGAIVFDGGGTLTITATENGAAYNDYAVSFKETADVGAAAPQVVIDEQAKTITIYVNNAADTDIADIDAAFDVEWIADKFTATSTAGDYTQGTDDTVTATTASGSDNGLTGDLVIELSGNTGSQVLQFESGTTLAQMLAAVNLVTDATGVVATQGTGGNANKLYFSSSEYGSDQFVNVNVIRDEGSFDTALDATRDSGSDVVATVNGVLANSKGNTLSISTATLSMEMKVAADTSSTNIVFDIDGGGALFQLGAVVTSSQQARIGINSVSTANLGGSSGLLYMLSSGGAAALETDSTLASQIVDQAMSQVSSLRGRLGAFQKTTLDSNIATLTDTLTNLTDAKSAITDTDFAEETANLTRAQILSQSGLSVLKLANQNPQQVLSLLQ